MEQLSSSGALVNPAGDEPNLVHLVQSIAALTGVPGVDRSGSVGRLVSLIGAAVNWARLLRRFRGHERVLLAHVMLFGYAYPGERDAVPADVIEELEAAIRAEPPCDARICRGPILAHSGSYAVAVNEWGFADARVRPHGPLSRDDVSQLPHA